MTLARSPLAHRRPMIADATLVAALFAHSACGPSTAPTTGDGATAPTSGESSGSSTTGASEATTSSGTTSDPGSTTQSSGSSTSDPATSTTGASSSGSTGTGSTTATDATTSGSSAGTGTTAGEATTGATDTSTTGAPLECDDYVGQVTPEETAITPQGDDEAEQLALEASGEIVAPPSLFERIFSDLVALRALHPEVAGIKARVAEANDAISIRFTAAGAAQIADKTYHAWDCPNALYHVDKIGGPKNDFVTLTFDGLYTLPLIYPDYLALDEVMKIFPIGNVDGDDVCAELVGDEILYIFDHGYGDCPEGCTDHDYWGFTVDAETNVTPLGTYSTMDGVMPPAWLTNATECKKWL